MTFLRYLIGPELIWLVLCIWTRTFARVNAASEGQYNKFIEGYATFVPVLILALTMLLFAVPSIPRKFLLLRIVLVAVIGSHFLLENVLNAHTKGGPGVGMIYLVAYILLFVAIPIAIVLKYLIVKN